MKFGNTVDLKELVQSELNERPEVRPFPEAVTRLIAACQCEDSTSESLAKIVECDAALAVRLLRMANSPLYGLTHEIKSIQHAASILGMRALKTLAMSVAGASMFSTGSTAAKERANLYRHSLAVGAVARVLAESEREVAVDEVFLASIFHDVGKLFLLDIVPDKYSDMNHGYVGEDLTSQERAIFGVTHEEIGLKSAHSWNLAESIKMAIAYHHRPAEALAHTKLTTIVHIADHLAKTWGLGTGKQYDLDVTDSIASQLSDEQTAIVRERAEALIAETQLCA